MTLRSILAPLVDATGVEGQLDAALGVAQSVGAHVNVLFIREHPATVIAALPEVAISAGATMDAVERGGREALAAARTAFDAWRQRHRISDKMPVQLSGMGQPVPAAEGAARWQPVATWGEQVGFSDAVIMQQGRLHDMVVINWPDSNHSITERVFDAAVFGIGRPVLLAPPRLPPDMLNHVMVAWNGSIEATRAVAGAMELLEAAQKVTIFSAARYDVERTTIGDLAQSLSWHGISARSVTPEEGEKSVGAAMLRMAAEAGVTMLVMGAYTHSRVRRLLLGGVTEHVLRHASIPVVMMQ